MSLQLILLSSHWAGSATKSRRFYRQGRGTGILIKYYPHKVFMSVIIPYKKSADSE
jgi:hypothetical protein